MLASLMLYRSDAYSTKEGRWEYNPENMEKISFSYFLRKLFINRGLLTTMAWYDCHKTMIVRKTLSQVFVGPLKSEGFGGFV